MPDDIHEPDPLEDAIAQWRSALSMSDTQCDELEDHLRTELAKLQDKGLSPRERVIIAADRMGDPLALNELWHQEAGVVLSIPRWLFASTILVSIPLAIWTALNASRETFNEIDDALQAMFGKGFDDTAELAVNWIASVLIIAIGGWVLVAGIRRRKTPRRIAVITLGANHV